MKVKTNIPYGFEKSFDRIQEVLDSNNSFDNISEVPNSDTLTYDNGYYFHCYAIFIDIRGSSKLPDKYQKRTLAKIYRAYISELVAIFQASENCKEINIVGDSVWGIYQAKTKSDVNEVYRAAFTSCSLINTLNYKLCQKNIDPIRIGIGIDKGSALMIQAGFKGSGINDVVYMGGVVNNASKLCGNGGKNGIRTIVISESVYSDLEGRKAHNEQFSQDFFIYNSQNDFYHASTYRVDMDEWLERQ